MLQSAVLDVLKCGENVFITGEAGSGKSYILKQYLQYLYENKVRPSRIAITASTGIAATQINGNTIHSWSCIGIHDVMSDDLIISTLRKRKDQREVIEDADILIIDEISMLHKRQLDLINRVLMIAKKSIKPFGGMQVILIGDFFQLPPVVKNSAHEFDRDRFCFMSQAWVDANFKICYITEQYRNNQGELNIILNAIRSCNLNERHFEALNKRKIMDSGLNNELLQLHTHNINVDAINTQKLLKLEGRVHTFTSIRDGNDKALKALESSILCPRNLELKIGAKVMFIKNNVDEGYVNGTQGEIIEFITDDSSEFGKLPVVKTIDGSNLIAEPFEWTLTKDDGKVIASIKQIPLRLAWAITVHKSQGMTLDEAIIDLGQTFEASQGYVALSRLRRIEGLFLKDIKFNALELNPLAKKADSRFKELSNKCDAEFLSLSLKDKEFKHKEFLKSLKH